MGEAGALARACGASELWELHGAVKQRAPGVANVEEGKQEAQSGEEGGGWQDGLVEGREGRGQDTAQKMPPRRSMSEGTCETQLQPRRVPVGSGTPGLGSEEAPARCALRGQGPPQGGAGRAEGDGAAGEN